MMETPPVEMVEAIHELLKPATLELELRHPLLTPALQFVVMGRKRAEKAAMTEILQAQMDAHRHVLLKQGIPEQVVALTLQIHAPKSVEMGK